MGKKEGSSGATSPRKNGKKEKSHAKNEKTNSSSDPDVIKCGMLAKKGHVRKNWRNQWFVLKENKLYYYEKKPNESKSKKKPAQPLGMIQLYPGCIALDSESQRASIFSVQSVEGNGVRKLYPLRAATQTLMQEWVAAISTACKQGPPSSSIGTAKTVSPRRATAGSNSSVRFAAGDHGHTGGSTAGVGGAAQGPAQSRARRSTAGSRSALTPDEQAGGTVDLYRLKFKFNGLLSHQNMPSEPEHANVHLQCIGGEMVVAHDYVLGFRAPVLAGVMESCRKKKRALIVVTMAKLGIQVHAETMRLFIEYLYGDTLPLAEVKALDALELFTLVERFQVAALRFQVLHHIRAVLSLQNVYGVLKRADEIQCEPIKSLALDFAHANVKEFVSNKEKTKSLGMELFHEVVALASQKYVPSKIDSDPPKSTLYQDFEALYQCTLKEDAKFRGDGYVQIYFEQIYFHKAVLVAHSKGFADALKPFAIHGSGESGSGGGSGSGGNADDCTKVLGVENVSAAAFRAALRFVYYGDTSLLSPLLACEVSPLASRLLMHDLSKLCASKMDRVDSTNALTVLQMAHQSSDKSMRDLKQKALQYVEDHLCEIDLSPLSSMEAQISVEILQMIQSQRALQLRQAHQKKMRSSSLQMPPPRAAMPEPADFDAVDLHEEAAEEEYEEAAEEEYDDEEKEGGDIDEDDDEDEEEDEEEEEEP